MVDTLTAARRFYVALRDRDVEALLDVLDPDLEGHTSAGMPNGVGGAHRSARAMIDEVWIPVYRDFDVAPVPDRFVEAGDEVVVLGRYVGHARGTEAPIDAAFVHALTVRDGRIVALAQVTDTHQWHAALDPHEDTARTRAVVQGVFEAVRARDLEGLLAFYADNVVVRDAPSLPYGGDYHGLHGVAEHGAGYLAAWDPYQAEQDWSPEEQIRASGDHGFARWTLRLRSADGTRAEFPVVSAFRVEGGKVVELQMLHSDTAGLLAFVEGATPVHAAEASSGRRDR